MIAHFVKKVKSFLFFADVWESGGFLEVFGIIGKWGGGFRILMWVEGLQRNL